MTVEDSDRSVCGKSDGTPQRLPCLGPSFHYHRRASLLNLSHRQPRPFNFLPTSCSAGRTCNREEAVRLGRQISLHFLLRVVHLWTFGLRSPQQHQRILLFIIILLIFRKFSSPPSLSLVRPVSFFLLVLQSTPVSSPHPLFDLFTSFLYASFSVIF